MNNDKSKQRAFYKSKRRLENTKSFISSRFSYQVEPIRAGGTITSWRQMKSGLSKGG